LPDPGPVADQSALVRPGAVPGIMLRVLITDDHEYIRLGLKQILLRNFEHVVIAEARNAQEALDQIWKQDWALVVLDIDLPGRSGLEVLREVRLARLKVPVLVLSALSEDEFAVRALKAGAAGFVNKVSAPEEFVQAVKKVLAGGKYVSSSVAEKLAAELTADSSLRPHESLSDRELQVMCLIASGRRLTQIAAGLSLSVKTISTYRARILGKMRMQTDAELIRYAIRNELVD